MTTPIYNFVQNYIKSDAVRFHMPAHKGKGPLGAEPLDITEIAGADVLYQPDGIIAESENIATEHFGTAHTFFSTEGSTLAIKAMLALAVLGKKEPLVLAARNAHKAFVYSAALLGFDVAWLYPRECSHICECRISKEELKAAINSMERLPDAVYVTSPDYLGNVADIKGLSEVCDSYGIPLLVDNAHGAYLAFLDQSRHPMALGAAMCADSAHKTLPALTGAAYLHVAKKAKEYLPSARNALSLFASTSPSYLILESLDLLNERLSTDYKCALRAAVERTDRAKADLTELGFSPEESEPLKIVINAKKYGYNGDELAKHLRGYNIECEFSDEDYLVLMTSSENTDADFEGFMLAMKAIKPLAPLPCISVALPRCESVMSIREAALSPSEELPAELCLGRTLAAATVSCPPAVPIAISGEIISRECIEAFSAYGIDRLNVVKK